MNSSSQSSPPANRISVADWKEIVAQAQKPSRWRAGWQMLNTFGLYAALWAAIYLLRGQSWWIILGLAALSGLLLVRVFIIFHDCGHGSYFKSPRVNSVVGFLSGILNFTPFYHWRWEHSRHHASAGDLDKRGTGDIWTMTVQEFLESSVWRRGAYRITRNPVVLFLIAPLILFVILQRFTARGAKPRERWSVWSMNLALLAYCALMSWCFGFKVFVLCQLTATAVSGIVGVWLFYVQHQFEGVYWERSGNWDFTAAALQGSSYYKLPKVLQWISGNIGFHHIHHLSSRIPNYNLERCHYSHPMFEAVKPITFLSSLKSLRFRLWDEPSRKLVGYKAARK